ncbi:uncharacterized protein B0H64DRAFT_437039 [Chaetomium fimeti]|uniref:Nudix hydrolase domain-containing protein n=1 Tax=Chaetomium fimeti TaxID=1854472 RepID=A0AAE0LX11_9PEZI|nr:hypothetical protein B0H64DRAFT_437039 [Chaetomium fimeti]
MFDQDQGRKGEKKAKKPPAQVRPSSSIILLSPTNQVLLLHRVQTSSSFASAHVFPGGNLSSFHDGPLPAVDTPALHEDGPAYRLAAIRETFEESGILLAKRIGQTRDQGLLQIPDDVRETGRKLVHGNTVKFTEWLRNQGGEPDVDNLLPFTRWITPHGPPKRFTTQMYLYMLPLSLPPSSNDLLQHKQALIPTPTHDGGLEHTAAAFDSTHTWLARARAGEIILFPPQYYLLQLIAGFMHPPSPPSSPSPKKDTEPTPASAEDYHAQRTALLAFLHRTPTSSPSLMDDDATDDGNDARTSTSTIPWSDKVMSPSMLFVRRRDGRVVLGLDKPGPELRGSGRGGDAERVVLVRFVGGGPREVEVRGREEVVREERVEDGEEGEEDGGGEGTGSKL